MTHAYFQIVVGTDDTNAGVATELKWEFDEDLVVTMFRFLMISSGAQLGRSGILHLGLSSIILVL